MLGRKKNFKLKIYYIPFMWYYLFIHLFSVLSCKGISRYVVLNGLQFCLLFDISCLFTFVFLHIFQVIRGGLILRFIQLQTIFLLMSVAHKLVKFGNISRGTNSNKKQNVTNVTQFWSILVALQQIWKIIWSTNIL